MPRITKGGVSDARDVVPDEDISPENTSVSTPEPDDRPEPKKAAPAKKTTAAKR